jgi:hypothetical protein
MNDAKEIPNQCPSCGTKFRRDAKHFRTQRITIILSISALVFTIAWDVGFYFFSPVYLYPKGLPGMAICGLVYFWPIPVFGVIASRFPRVLDLACKKCDWKERFLCKKLKR